ncbi:S8 family serine peptidase [Solwaraspora sp. WMMD406]|uniref:S8 family serine peptidase n=1 Tax=Solwaraspora sp. WMMD406 TaxID=3016095 RepID=UPI0024176F82|nr:S8 family serine peptidase [Solwaraspora sp. WMMD406]MDG4766317.1 S8 family serine peptidase [Solwaraspora sp. WMMD406]
MAEPEEWDVRTLLVLAQRSRAIAGTAPVLREVALRFGDALTDAERTYRDGEPRWHQHVRDALDRLRRAGLVSGTRTFVLTTAGRARAADHTDSADTRQQTASGGSTGEPPPVPAEGGAERTGGRAERTGPTTTSHRPADAPPADAPPADAPPADAPPADAPPAVAVPAPGIIAAPLRRPSGRRRIGFPADPDEPMPVLVALNLHFDGGARRAMDQLAGLWFRVTAGRHPQPLAGEYAVGELSVNQMKRLVAADSVEGDPARRSVHRVWPDFPVAQQIDVSTATIKADAARRTFAALGERIVWAVVDSGIDATHPHFSRHATVTAPEVRDLHRTFPAVGPPRADGALVDETGHGTHVAGIIAGGLDGWAREQPDRVVRVIENHYDIDNPDEPIQVPRPYTAAEPLTGIAPLTRLVSLKVLHGGGGLTERVSRVISALAYVRHVNAGSDRVMRIHGVNLSVGYEFDPEWFACGQSPLCREVDKLVRSGVVVVTAAGNSGYGSVAAPFGVPSRFTLGMTINDPGNAERAITVGSTHRDMPHTYGVSYFSSKGPTGDGRHKPDLVAPGERIVSCAAGVKLTAALAGWTGPQPAVYLEESGTSVAAPHVSGAIAAFLSVRREFIGQPERVKQVMVSSAVPLGRDRQFQGHGLVDLLRALQSV